MCSDLTVERLLIKLSQLELELKESKQCNCKQWRIDSLKERIMALKLRIIELEKLNGMPEKLITYERGAIFNNAEVNRIQVEFVGDLSEDELLIIKIHGFRWSEREQVWQRLRSRSSMIAAIDIFGDLGRINNG